MMPCLQIRIAMLGVLESAAPKQEKLLSALDGMLTSMRDPDIKDKRLDKLAKNVEDLSYVLYNNEVSHCNMRRMVLGLEPNMRVIER